MSKEFKNINFKDINLEDYEDIKVEMDDIKKAKMKKSLRSKIIGKNKRIKKRVAIVAGLSLIMTLGIISQPAIAQNIPIFNTAYEALGFSKEYLAESKYIGMSVEDKGTKVTIENIAADENNIKLTMKIESENEKLIGDHSGISFDASFEGIKFIGESRNHSIAYKNTKLIVIGIDSIEKIPQSGQMIINVNGERYDFKESFKFDIDFKESFSKIIEKDVILDKAIEGVDIYGLKTSTIGSLLEISQESVTKDFKTLYINVDGKIYEPKGYYSNENKTYLEYENLLYNEVVNAKDIYVTQNIGDEKVVEEGFYIEEIDGSYMIEGGNSIKVVD